MNDEETPGARAGVSRRSSKSEGGEAEMTRVAVTLAAVFLFVGCAAESGAVPR